MKKAAFTLAEVLITLGIIGVVAALTIPSLIANYKDKETIVKLKKVYSVLSQAYQRAVFDNGAPDSWNLVAAGDSQGAQNLANTLNQYLNVGKNCGPNDGCYVTQGPDYAKTLLTDGIPLLIYVRNPNCAANYGSNEELASVCGSAAVQINNHTFEFWLTKETVVPIGGPDETFDPFATRCDGKLDDFIPCTAWTIYNENFDYLRCKSDLSWTGKTKCD